jgi:hypothetical protein
LPHAVEQEIYAKALMHNIAQALCSEAAQQLEVEKRELAGQPCVCSKENVGAVVVKKTARVKVKALASSKTEMYQFKT